MRPQEFISIENFTHRLSQAVKYTKYIYLHILGEPLLHPELDLLLEICDSFNVYVNIVTNGILINNTADILNKHKCIRKVAFSLQSYLANEIKLSVLQYLKPIVDYADSTKAIIEFRFLSQYNNEELYNYISQAFMNKNKENLFITFADEFNWPSLEKQKNQVKYCKGLIDQFGILVDGTVVPCCLDCDGIINLGSITKQPLSEILSNPRAEAIRKGFFCHKPSEPLCLSCSYAVRFG